jgi:transcriptional regulator with XRE-family HTH domain
VARIYHGTRQRSTRHTRLAETVGTKVCEIRLSQGISMRHIEDHRGPRVGTVCLVESALVNMKVETLHTIAQILGVHVAAFFVEDDAGINEADAFVYSLTNAELAILREMVKKEE